MCQNIVAIVLFGHFFGDNRAPIVCMSLVSFGLLSAMIVTYGGCYGYATWRPKVKKWEKLTLDNNDIIMPPKKKSGAGKKAKKSGKKKGEKLPQLTLREAILAFQ